MPKENVKDSRYDLEERTTLFAENIIDYCKKIPRSCISEPIIKQLIRSADSVAANYCEADDAESAKDFVHKIAICKKEARETKLHIRLLHRAYPELKEKASGIYQEAKELNLIFNKICRSTKQKYENP